MKDKFKHWNLFSGLKKEHKPLVIAGPCSAESEEQLLNTARELKMGGAVHALRAGVWKPRTRPDSFEGIGVPALSWLRRAGDETGLPVMTEVANAFHVEQALKHGIDMLWIGARTTVNPFYIQEIADALKGSDIPVFVKNPIHPEIGLWLGAIERLEKSGIEQVAAVHRGFFTYNLNPFRNDPKWEVSIDLRAQRPDIPILCDPSHISGKRDYLKEVAQAALDLQLDGLMIESHINPEKALSDADQQITPANLLGLISGLIVRKEDCPDVDTIHRLEFLRSEIDKVDQQLLEVLAHRKEIVEHIGDVKKENNIAILQFQRWFEILHDRARMGVELQIDKEFINELFQLIHKFSIETQQKIMNKNEVEEIKNEP